MILSPKFLLLCYILSITIIGINQNKIISYIRDNGNSRIKNIDLYFIVTIFYIIIIFIRVMINFDNFINDIDLNNNLIADYHYENNININNNYNINDYQLIENRRKYTKSDKKLKKENEALKEQIAKLSTNADDINESYLCSICMTNPKNCLITPCNHLAICSVCNAEADLHTCPYCRTKISSIKKIYV
jgi:cell division protein FtsB